MKVFYSITLVISIFNAVSAQSINNKNSIKQVIATYQNAMVAGEWSGLTFIDVNDKEINFINKNNQGKIINSFWNNKSTGEDPDDVTITYHTIKENVGKRYKIEYQTKKIKYTGFDQYGSHWDYENVIVTFKLL